MCRYALKQYKSHFACFECKKAFKKTPVEDYVKHKGIDASYDKICRVFATSKRQKVESELGITYQQIQDMYYEDLCVCPECGGKMALMGLDFRPPKKNDYESWEIIQVLYDHGYSFKGCGCFVGYWPPKKKSEITSWLEEHRTISESEKLLNLFKSRRA